MRDKLIYTLGTDLRRQEDFMEILLAYEIGACVDVRSFPRSKLPHFTRQALEMLLRSNGISYHFLGRELGGFRSGGYAAYTATTAFSDGVSMLERIGLSIPSVIICSERLPWRCHRKWIARELLKRGWRVEHIIDKGRVWAPKQQRGKTAQES